MSIPTAWCGRRFPAAAQLASFDRSKCKVLNGPTATGQHCPEGWTMYPVPGPQFKGTDVIADYLLQQLGRSRQTRSAWATTYRS